MFLFFKGDCFMAFFFSNNFAESPIIKKAFEILCINKLKKDYYCDMSEYIFARINKMRFTLLCLRWNHLLPIFIRIPFQN